ncbi:MAG: DUF2764 family protein [Lentisphaerae bacterium]|nr:DUF2764 family protein [Lentisphaerota bacterium]
MNYYYFAASLPRVSLEEPAPMPLERFVEQAVSLLRPGDAAELQAVISRPESAAGQFGRAWAAADAQIRNAQARARGARLKRDSARYLREEGAFDSYLESGVAEAFSRSSPLERELALDRLRWKKLDEIGGLNPFAPAAIMAYALKLALAERWTRMDRDRGLERARGLVAAASAGETTAPTENT